MCRYALLFWVIMQPKRAESRVNETAGCETAPVWVPHKRSAPFRTNHQHAPSHDDAPP